MSEEKQDPYDGLSPYGIAVTALERILELDSGWMSWDEARAIASEAHGLAVAEASAEPQPAPEPRSAIPLADLSDREKLDLIGGAAQAYDYENRPRDRSWTAVPLDQVARLVTGALGSMEFAQPAPELAAAMAESARFRNWLDDFTHVVVDLGEARVVRVAERVRAKAGLPPVKP